ncbi:PhzF family phenazine biosynthesis isomerase, partial [Stenotrophomonas sp. HMWF003]|uniref:PhzF family phenazine biosynthesis protein n=1 Tax=Stenotrophomonas sp. HMWF003 TaxID=2056840 RepID=UPI000D4EF0B7
MTSRRFLQLDVFSPYPGAGNPLAVVLDAEGLDEAAMQAIARWTRLPETTFVFAPEAPGSSYRLRMFSPQKEVPFAGHPSVGTAHAVLEEAVAAPVDGVLVQDGIAGTLPLQVDGTGAARTIAIRTPRASVAEVAQPNDPRLQAALAGWSLGALPPARMAGGRSWWVVELRDEATLRALRPDWDAIAA